MGRFQGPIKILPFLVVATALVSIYGPVDVGTFVIPGAVVVAYTQNKNYINILKKRNCFVCEKEDNDRNEIVDLHIIWIILQCWDCICRTLLFL